MSATETGQAVHSRLDEAAEILRVKMEFGRIPLIIMGSGMSAGVFAPTMRQIHEYLAKQIREKVKAQKLDENEQRLVETILALLYQLTASKPPIWNGDETPDSPRSIQVRLYYLLQTSQVKCIQEVWQDFGNALLLRKMVSITGDTSIDSKSLPELDPSRAHIWAAILALNERAIVASLNYDGLSRRAIEMWCGKYMMLPKTDHRTSRILTTADEIRGFFTGNESKLMGDSKQIATKGKLPWKPIPIIKFRGDVFHAVCHNTRCPEVNKATPLYFLFPSDPSGLTLDREAILTKKLQCDCCRYPRQLEISFPGVFDKELQIDQELAAFHQFFGAKIAGIIFLGFSGSWDESLVDYLARRAAKLDIPIVSFSKSDTLALKDAADRYFKTPRKSRERYFQFIYESGPPNAGGKFLDEKLMTLLSIPQPPVEDETVSTIQTSEAFESELELHFPKNMPSQFSEQLITIHRNTLADDSVLKVNVKKVSNEDEIVQLYNAALKTDEFERLQACSQLGIKGILLREKNPEKHTRFHHSAAAAQIARLWFEVLQCHPSHKSGFVKSEEYKIILDLAVLFHDARHLPFSHMMEEVFRELNCRHLQ